MVIRKCKICNKELISSFAHAAKVLSIASLLSLGSVAGAQTGEVSSGVDHTCVTSPALPNDPGRSLTTVVVELALGAKAASHRHAGIVFAYVLEGYRSFTRQRRRSDRVSRWAKLGRA